MSHEHNLSISRIMSDLSSWYSEDPDGKEASRIHNLTSNMFGSDSNRICKPDVLLFTRSTALYARYYVPLIAHVLIRWLKKHGRPD